MKEKKIIIGIIVVILIFSVIAGVLFFLKPKKENKNIVDEESQNLLANKDEESNFDITLKEDGTKDDKIKTAETKIGELKSPIDSEYELFYGMMELDKDILKQSWNIDTSLLSAYVAKMPMMNVKANMYAIFKPVNGKKEEVKAQMESYLNSYEEQWSMYLPDQYELVKKREFEEINGYLVCVISEDNQAFLDVVRQALQ